MSAAIDAVESYIASAPREQQPALAYIRALVRKHLPRAAESIGSSGFPVYTDGNGTWLTGIPSYVFARVGPFKLEFLQ